MNNDSTLEIFDVAVIGGGIAGAAVAREAALQKKRVILFEKNTFGSGTSSKSSKLIHGGLRYLEIAWDALLRGRFGEFWKNFKFVFHALAECRALSTELPELVTPLPLVIPIYQGDRRGRFVVFSGVFLYFLLALFSGKAKWPRFFWTQKSALQVLPDLEPRGLVGGVLIWDHLTDDQALVQKTIAIARQNGATCFEQTLVARNIFLKDKNCFEIEIQREGTTQIIYSKKIVDASGAWMGSSYVLPIAGSHLNFKKFIPVSTILQARDGRIFFGINFKDFTRVGTTEWPCKTPDEVTVPETDIAYLLESLQRYFPSKQLKRSDIVSMDAGIRPLALYGDPKNPTALSREHEIRIDAEGILHLVGVKLTDHRRAARETLDQLKK